MLASRMLRFTLLTTLALALAMTSSANAQERRRSPGGPPPNGDVGIPRQSGDTRHPYVGAWEGTMTMKPQPGEAGRPIPISMVFDLADTSTVQYGGATIFPGNARAPHLETKSERGSLTWQQRNSGRGMFTYTARLASPDSIVGTVILRDSDWPTPPTGSFVLVRKKA